MRLWMARTFGGREGYKKRCRVPERRGEEKESKNYKKKYKEIERERGREERELCGGIRRLCCFFFKFFSNKKGAMAS